MSFYNPYSKYPDVSQGVGDLFSQLMQMMLMKKYMGGSGGPTTTQLGPTPVPQQGQSAKQFAGNASAMAPAPGAMPGGVDQEQLLKYLLQYLGR
jgi:hypothetical protein